MSLEKSLRLTDDDLRTLCEHLSSLQDPDIAPSQLGDLLDRIYDGMPSVRQHLIGSEWLERFSEQMLAFDDKSQARAMVDAIPLAKFRAFIDATLGEGSEQVSAPEGPRRFSVENPQRLETEPFRIPEKDLAYHGFGAPYLETDEILIASCSSCRSLVMVEKEGFTTGPFAGHAQDLHGPGRRR